jgi:hypothetical protein
VELGIKINKSIDRDDAQGAADAAKAYKGYTLCHLHIHSHLNLNIKTDPAMF